MSQVPEKPETQECERCGQPAIRICEECRLLYCCFCEDQDHWSKCTNYEVHRSDKDSYFLKTSRDLLPGEIIFEESPVVFAPKLPFVDGRVACVGCCRSISTENCPKCPECLWPACSSECEHLKNAASHGLECEIFKSHNSAMKTLRFEILMSLRLLLLQRSNRVQWEKLKQSIQTKTNHTVKFDPTDETNKDLEYLREILLTSEASTSEQLIQEILIFSKNNTFNVSEDNSVQILYSASDLIQHSCIPNSIQILHQDPKELFKMTTRANSRISKNSPINISYTDLFQTTCDRRSQLKISKNLTCSCARCQDPTEFNTFFSALKCMGSITQPCSGTQLPIDPTDEQTLWICDRCNIELPNDQMVKFLEHLRIEVDKIISQESTDEELEEFLAKLLMFLHENHSYVCRIKLALVKKYTGEDLVATKIELCQGLIKIFKKLSPNGGLLIGQILHELLQAKLLFFSDDSDGDQKREIEEIFEEMKTNVEGVFDGKFRSVVAEDEVKFAAWVTRRAREPLDWSPSAEKDAAQAI